MAIFDLCEVVAGEVLDGGGGSDTLITPVSLSQLQQLGVTVKNFEQIQVQPANSCKSECFDRNECGPGGQCLVQLSLPRGLPADAAGFVAGQGFTIAAGTVVEDETHRPGTVANAGTDAAVLATGARTGDVWSVGEVRLAPTSRVDGTVRTAGVAISRASDAIVTGETLTEQSLSPLSRKAWLVSPPSFFSPVAPNPGANQTATLAPGAYQSVIVRAGATLLLKTGTYYAKSFTMASGSKVRLDQSAGPVYLYVLSALSFAGTVTATDGGRPKLLVGYLGAASVTVQSPFRGTLVAPAAEVTLAKTATAHEGAFLAARLATEAGARISLVPSLVPTVAFSGRNECMQRVSPDACLPEPQRQEQLERDVFLYCDAAGAPRCEARMLAVVNADRRAAAQRYMAEAFDTPDYLALVRDRSRKAHRMLLTPSAMAAYCIGDADGDLIPDSIDRCPGTPPLTPTDDVGCPGQPKPPAPPRVIVDMILSKMGIVRNPRCDNAPAPTIPSPQKFLAFECFSDHIYLTKVDNQPPGCDVWYELSVYLPQEALVTREGQPPGSGAPGSVYLAYADVESQASPHVAGDPPVDLSAPPGQILFVESAGASRDRAKLSTSVWPTVVISARATNGSGKQSPWSAPVAFSGNCNLN